MELLTEIFKALFGLVMTALAVLFIILSVTHTGPDERHSRTRYNKTQPHPSEGQGVG